MFLRNKKKKLLEFIEYSPNGISFVDIFSKSLLKRWTMENSCVTRKLSSVLFFGDVVVDRR